MKRILVFGAGKSAFFTIHYLLDQVGKYQWQVTVADSFPENIRACTADFPEAKTVVLDVNDTARRQELVKAQDIVISLLPARFHILLAEDCLLFGKHLITPSYITPELEAMDAAVRAKGLLFLNELGLDPGIDHMSAMHIIHRLREEGAQITAFRSYCGGLVAPESDDHPWHYKFSWNPYNVIRAGADGGLCLQNGKLQYVPYHRLFKEITLIQANGEAFEAYLNRNSLRYIPIYELEGVNTFVRGTLRTPGFCPKWNLLVQAGLTSEKITVNTGSGMPWPDFFNIFLPLEGNTMDEKLSKLAGEGLDNAILQAFHWLLDGENLPAGKDLTPAEALQILLERKWKMEPQDKDRVVMVHEFEYLKAGKKYKLTSWMDLEGENASRTAMARTVGLPLALAAEMIATERIRISGVILPTVKEVYEPLLHALAEMGIRFHEEEQQVD